MPGIRFTIRFTLTGLKSSACEIRGRQMSELGVLSIRIRLFFYINYTIIIENANITTNNTLDHKNSQTIYTSVRPISQNSSSSVQPIKNKTTFSIRQSHHIHKNRINQPTSTQTPSSSADRVHRGGGVDPRIPAPRHGDLRSPCDVSGYAGSTAPLGIKVRDTNYVQGGETDGQIR